MPPFTRTRAVWYTVALTAVSCSGLVVWTIYGFKGVPNGLNLAAIFLPLVGSLFATRWFARWSRRLREQALAADGRVCWECGYALTGLADRGECPECGTAYEAEALRRRWQLPPRKPDRT